MHPFTVTESRASRRRARRAAIAVVAGLLAIPGTKAFADPPQQQFRTPHPHVRGPQGWHQSEAPKHATLPGGHAGVHYVAAAEPTADDGGTSVDWEIPAIIAASVLTAGGLVLTQRRRVGTAT
jgi:hypothetical protein